MNLETNTNTTMPRSCGPVVPAALDHPRLAPQDRERLILENLPEVRYIARHIHARLPPHVPFDDLVQAGILGLIDAVDKFDSAKNVTLEAYARFRIRGGILDSLRALDWSPRSLRRQARRIEEANDELTCKLARLPSEPEVAVHLGVQLNELQNILRELHCLTVERWPELSEFTSHEGGSAAQSIRSGPDPFELCLRSENIRTLMEAIDTLDEKERRALTLYYFEELTMKEVGKVLDICESRVSQIISAALDNLRVHLQERMKAQEREHGQKSESCPEQTLETNTN